MSEEPTRGLEELYRVVLDGVPDLVIYLLDHQGHVTHWNAGAAKLLGYAEADSLGQSFSRFFTSEDIQRGEPERILRVAAESGKSNDEHWQVRQDDSRFWSIGTTVAIRDEQGELTGFGRVVRDRTEQRRAEEAVKASEQRYRALVENAWDGVTLVAADGTIIETTPTTFRGLGYFAQEYLGRNGFDLLHPEDAPIVRGLLKQVLQQPGGKLTTQYRLRHKDGSWRWVEATAANLLQEPSVRAVVINHRDVTEQKEADRRKDEWLSMLAHELRGPLSPVSNAVQVLLLRDAGERDVQQAREVIARQTQHLARIVDDLLEVTRLLRGQVRIRRHRLDLAGLIRTAAEDYRPVVQQAGMSLAVEVPDTPVWVSGDATRLSQVLGNLLDNAVKFRNGGSRVEVRLRADTEHRQALFTVADAGIGIEPQLLPVLFDVFAQAEKSLHRTRGGLGLGLSLVKGLVGLHGGEVRVASAGPGKGAEFTVLLPLETELAALSEMPESPPRAVEPLRILVVEDNRDAANSLQMLLTLAGHEVRVAYTGPDGVKAATEWTPDVIISDIGLPGLDGYAVASELRRNPATANARMIAAVTGYGGEEERQRILASGFDYHLTKPADPALLQRLLVRSM